MKTSGEKRAAAAGGEPTTAGGGGRHSLEGEAPARDHAFFVYRSGTRSAGPYVPPLHQWTMTVRASGE
jgi:hypothetical protein